MMLAAVGRAASVEPPAAEAQSAAPWTSESIRQLIRAIEAADAEGLNPSDYGLSALRRGAEEEDAATRDALASRAAFTLAHDYYFGRVSDHAGMDWRIERAPYEADQLAQRLRDAQVQGRLDEFYASLLPSDSRYKAMREALAAATDKAARDRLRVNMERWRWMPRRLPADYIYVNVPSYRLQLFEGGAALSSYDVIVGAKDTPTPQMVSPADSLVVNPAWYVPDSIVKKSNLRAGRGGYVWKATGDGGRRLVQLPGAANALGRIKFNLINDSAIYLHDTNVPRAFGRDVRALSHGCVRVKDIDQLAAELMSRGGDEGRLEEALAGSDTTTIRLPRRWPVYIVYFTADLDDAGGIATYADPYNYDGRVLAALDGPLVRLASN